MSEKDVLIEELCNTGKSLHINEKKKSPDKEAAEAIRKKAMERMKIREMRARWFDFKWC